MVTEKEKLKNKYTKAIRSLATLEDALVGMHHVAKIAQCAQQPQEQVYRIYRDSLVQRFEYTFDTTWKYISEYLQHGGYQLTMKSPKAIFRECFKARILSEEETRCALEMVGDRNLTTHGYDEDLIEETSKKIVTYAQLLSVLLQRTKDDL